MKQLRSWIVTGSPWAFVPALLVGFVFALIVSFLFKFLLGLAVTFPSPNYGKEEIVAEIAGHGLRYRTVSTGEATGSVSLRLREYFPLESNAGKGKKFWFYDVYVLDGEAEFEFVPENAWFSVGLLVDQKMTGHTVSAFVTEGRPSELIGDLYAAQSWLSNGTSHSFFEELYSVNGTSFHSVQFEADVEPVCSWIKYSISDLMFNSTAFDNASARLIKSKSDSKEVVQQMLDNSICEIVRTSFGESIEGTRDSFRVYCMRLLSGSFQLGIVGVAGGLFFIFSVAWVSFRFSDSAVAELEKEAGELRRDPVRYSLRSSDLYLSMLPSIGLMGTIYGVSVAVGKLGIMVRDKIAIQQLGTSSITTNLGVAFDTTLLATLLWIVLSVMRLHVSASLNNALKKNGASRGS